MKYFFLYFLLIPVTALILSFCKKTDTAIVFEPDEYVPEERIMKLKQAIVGRDSILLASMLEYPVQREYPLRNILDSAQMIAYFDILFDDSIRAVLSQTQIDDWSSFGWRGHSFSYGEYLWVNGDALCVNYYSERELMLRNELIQQEMSSLDASLAGTWQPYICMLDDDGELLFRIDYIPTTTEDNLYASGKAFRLAIYSLKDDLRAIPQKVMMGHLSIEGSACFHYLSFDDEQGLRIDISEDHSDKDGFWRRIAMTTPAGDKHEYSAMECYWLDFLN